MEEAKAAVSFLRDARARFASHPSVHTKLYALLTAFGKGEIADVRAVVTRAEALLQGQPDLIARFNAFLAPNPKSELTDEDITAAKQRSRKDDRRSTPVTAGLVGARDDSFDKALLFLQRVKHTDAELYDRVLAELSYVKMEERMDAHQVYARAEEIFGQAHSDLLHGFAEFLPAEHDPPPSSAEEEPEEHRRTSKRKPAPSAIADDVPSKPSRAKKPRADDRKNRRALIDGGATAQDDDVVVVFRKAWEFETEYSKLVATTRQAERLQKERAQGASSSASRRQRAYEDLFPSRECREYLEDMYNHGWKPIQEALEDGERTDLALATIMRRLREKEDVAVEEAMARRDAARAHDRLKKLVMDQVRAARENQRHQRQHGDRRDPRERPAGKS